MFLLREKDQGTAGPFLEERQCVPRTQYIFYWGGKISLRVTSSGCTLYSCALHSHHSERYSMKRIVLINGKKRVGKVGKNIKF